MAKNIEKKVEEVILKSIEELGFELYDVEYVKEGKDYFLRIFIDNQNGINLNDCEKVNNIISPILDEVDCIKEQYFLEVSSPGIERVLRKDKHFINNINNKIEIKLFKPINKKRTLTGILKKYDSKNIKIKTEEENEIIIDKRDIAIVKTVYRW